MIKGDYRVAGVVVERCFCGRSGCECSCAVDLARCGGPAMDAGWS